MNKTDSSWKFAISLMAMVVVVGLCFMVLTACKAGKKPKTVVMPKGNTIIKLVVQVINRILKGDSYEVLYDRNK